nr:hydroxyacid dehydrogenase [Actinomycetota bacterium]
MAPANDPGIADAIGRGGGLVVPLEDADAIVWIDPRSPERLKDALARSPARWVQLPFAGIEAFVTAGVIDRERTWTCAKGVYGHATAEHALTLILAAARGLNRHLRATTWHDEELAAPERRLIDATILIVGTGGIGTALASMVAPLGPRILGVNRSGEPLLNAERTASIKELAGLLPEANFVVLAAPLTLETNGLFDEAMLRRMKPGAWLVNVARGGLVMTEALVTVLEEGRLGGAALDVTDPEPLPDHHPLWTMSNVIVTPHVANTWAMGLRSLTQMVQDNVARFAAGEELAGVVDPDAGY